jgi:uncharacterized protein (DUF433 family)
MINWSSCPVVERDPERVGGAWVFAGTRVPVAALFENLEDGALVSQFVEWFPGVTIEQVRGVLEHAAQSSRSRLNAHPLRQKRPGPSDPLPPLPVFDVGERLIDIDDRSALDEILTVDDDTTSSSRSTQGTI